MFLIDSSNDYGATPISCTQADGGEEWFAIHTRSRHEKKVAAQLEAERIRCFLPLVSRSRRWSDRNKIIEEPLFPGYVFVRIDGTHTVRLAVRKTHGVVGFVGAQGRGIPIPHHQIHDIESVLASDVPFTLFPFLEVGQRVRIRGGCLDGVEGILLSKNEDRSLVVSIDLIRRSLAVRVEGFEVEPIKWNGTASLLHEARVI